MDQNDISPRSLNTTLDSSFLSNQTRELDVYTLESLGWENGFFTFRNSRYIVRSTWLSRVSKRIMYSTVVLYRFSLSGHPERLFQDVRPGGPQPYGQCFSPLLLISITARREYCKLQSQIVQFFRPDGEIKFGALRWIGLEIWTYLSNCLPLWEIFSRCARTLPSQSNR
jgi:hypothetical protein